MTLEFSERDELMAVRVVIAKSDDFYEADVGVLEAANETYYRRYLYLQKECSFTLGNPAYTGRWDDVDFPADSIAIEVCYWDLPEGRFQIEYDDLDKELPIFIWLSWYRPGE